MIIKSRYVQIVILTLTALSTGCISTQNQYEKTSQNMVHENVSK